MGAPAGIVSWHKFENDLLDSAGSHHASGISTIEYPSNSLYDGQAYAVSYNAGNLNFSIPPSAGYAFSSFTICFWVRKLNQADFATFINPTDGEFSIELLSGSGGNVGQVRFARGGFGIASSQMVGGPDYYHFACVANGTQLELYMDAVSMGTLSVTAIPGNTRGFNIGPAYVALDSLRIYNQPLLSSEVQWVFDSESFY